jgi:hypothetical protein
MPPSAGPAILGHEQQIDHPHGPRAVLRCHGEIFDQRLNAGSEERT